MKVNLQRLLSSALNSGNEYMQFPLTHTYNINKISNQFNELNSAEIRCLPDVVFTTILAARNLETVDCRNFSCILNSSTTLQLVAPCVEASNIWIYMRSTMLKSQAAIFLWIEKSYMYIKNNIKSDSHVRVIELKYNQISRGYEATIIKAISSDDLWLALKEAGKMLDDLLSVYDEYIESIAEDNILSKKEIKEEIIDMFETLPWAE